MNDPRPPDWTQADECSTCRPKPGTPLLCSDCLRRRKERCMQIEEWEARQVTPEQRRQQAIAAQLRDLAARIESGAVYCEEMRTENSVNRDGPGPTREARERPRPTGEQTVTLQLLDRALAEKCRRGE